MDFRKPIGYLIRVGNLDQAWPLLADKPLSQEGIEQSNAAADFFSMVEIGCVRSPRLTAGLQMAEIITAAISPVKDAPQAFIYYEEDMPVPSLLNPGGIAAVYTSADGQGVEYVAQLNGIDISRLD